MGKSSYLSNAFANYVSSKGATAMPVIGGLYIALFESGAESSYSGYVRQQITPGAVSNGAWSNTNDILFPADSAASHTITEYRIYDASTAGNEYYSEVLGTSVSMPTNEQFEFKAGQVTVTES